MTPTLATLPFPLTPGAPAVPITDGGNAPAGLFLINRGDNAGAILIQPGPVDTGAALAIGPGGSIPWNDPAVLPYATLPRGASKPETLVVSSQITGYDNPQALAVAVALQIATEGIPNTFLDTSYGTFRLLVTKATPPLIVGLSASLLVSVAWPQPAPVGANVLRLTFDDPDVPDLPALTIFLTANNAIDPGMPLSWQVPVIAPRLIVTNLATDGNNADGYVSIVGNNRNIPRLRQFGGTDETIPHYLSFTGNMAGVSLNLLAGVEGAAGQTRYNGPVMLSLQAPAAGFIHAGWVAATGAKISMPIPVAGAAPTQITWGHPPVPVYWRYQPNAAINGTVSLGVTPLS